MADIVCSNRKDCSVCVLSEIEEFATIYLQSSSPINEYRCIALDQLQNKPSCSNLEILNKLQYIVNNQH